MEQAQHWMWLKRRELLKSHASQATMNSFSDSWEERAFAVDAAGFLGGCVWPPRSYSCSFCKREFKSAQALGGHMNVHRRDRARLKQSFTLHNEVLHQQNHNQNSHHSLDPKCPSEICTSDYNNLDHTPAYPINIFSSTTLSPTTTTTTRFSALSTQENLSKNALGFPDSSSLVQGKPKNSPSAYTSSWSNSVVKTFLNISDSKTEPERNPAEEDSISTGHDYYVETNLSMSLNSVFCRDRPTGSCGDEAISCKRTKTTAVATLPFFLSNDKYGLQMEVLGLRSTSKENLDLELRLGDPPKLK